MVALVAYPFPPWWVVVEQNRRPYPCLAWEVQAGQEEATEHTYSAGKNCTNHPLALYYLVTLMSNDCIQLEKVFKAKTCCAIISFSSFSLALTSLRASSLSLMSSSTLPVYSRINCKWEREVRLRRKSQICKMVIRPSKLGCITRFSNRVRASIVWHIALKNKKKLEWHFWVLAPFMDNDYTKNKQITCNKNGKAKSIMLFVQASSRATSGRIKS